MASLPTDATALPDNSEPLKYKTWVLKVSIHCEGCKRKVKRILHSVEGVYTIDVDARQHKVVVTGNVDGSTLVRKLEKSGKHAELWPDFYKLPNNEQPQPQNQNQNQNPNIENQNVTFNLDQPLNNNNNESQKVADNNCGPPPQQQQVRFEGNVAGEPQKPPGGVGGGSEGGGGSGGGGKKKKKKKKGNNGNSTTNTNNGGNNNNNNNSGPGCDVPSVGIEQHGTNGGPPITESQPHPHPNPNPNPNPNPDNMCPPRHQPNDRVYEYSPPYYGPPPPPPPPPVYAVSYNTAYPSSNYSASYYSAPPPYSYAYVHQSADVDASAPSDSFEIFSDENPNACAVM